jgi:hypothetical protein
MNERIKSLIERAEYQAKKQSGYEDWEVYVTPDSQVVFEKFAEMLINECISIVDEQKECLHEEQQYWHDRDYGYEMAVNDASKGIKQFFGVEE